MYASINHLEMNSEIHGLQLRWRFKLASQGHCWEEENKIVCSLFPLENRPGLLSTVDFLQTVKRVLSVP